MLNLSNGDSSFSVLVIPYQRSSHQSTFGKVIFVSNMASTSCNVIAKYDLDSYDTRYIFAAFMELERKVKERYKLLKVHFACFLTLILPITKP